MSMSLITTCILLFASNRAEYTIDGDTAIQSSNIITCNQGDDCVVNCNNCNNNVEINCEAGFGCTINCNNCGGISIQADTVPNFNFTCNTECSSSSINVQLTDTSSQFSLNCYGDALNDGCRGSDITITHPESVYTGTEGTINSININCQGEGACEQVYIDSTINGHFSAICNGYQACGWSKMVYNPPLRTGQMDLACAGTNNTACYCMGILSLSAKQINIDCGNGIDTSTPKLSPCYQLSIQGPVLPFDKTVTEYSWTNMNTDSITLNCYDYECQSINIAVPFGINQVTENNYIYDWDRTSSIRYECGWDFASSGWNHPERRLSCECQETLETIVLQKLIDGATVDVTNMYTFDLSLQSIYTCPIDKHCIIYSMERYYSYGYYKTFQGYVDNGHSTSINCPTDTVSYCYVFAVLPYGLSLSQIDGSKTSLLLLRGLDSSLEAESAFTSAIIYGPDSQYVTDGILFGEAGNAVGSFKTATINVQNTPMVIFPQIFDALIGAIIYANDAEWLQIDCDYHSMCDSLQIYANHNNFDKNGGVTGVIPNNVCIACSQGYQASCQNMILHVTDTINNIVYDLIATPYQITVENEQINDWYWENSNENIKVAINPTGSGMGSSNSCSDQTETKLGGSWYGGDEDSCNGGNGNGGADVFEYAPDTCDWFYVVGGYSPPSNECFITFGDETLFSYKQQCLTGGIADFTVYFNSTDCSGDGTNMVVGPDGMIYGDCSVGNNCAYVKYEQTRYSAQATALCDESFAVGTEKGAVISDVCLGGQKYTCSGTGSSATLTRERFNDVECSNDAIETTVFHIGDCTDGIKLTSFECFSSEPTPPPAPAPTPSCDEDDSLDRQDCQDDGCEGDNVYLSFTLTFDVCTINPFKGKRKGLWNKISDCICQLGLDDEFDGMEIDYIDELETERRRLYRGSSQNKCKFDIVKYTKNKLTEDMKGCDEIDNSYGFEFGVEGCGKCVDLQNVYDGFEGYTSDEIIDRVTACSKAIAKAEDNIGFKIVDNVEFDYLLKDDNDECKLVTGGADIQFKYNVLVVIGVSAILSMYI
eukprot:316685_1